MAERVIDCPGCRTPLAFDDAEADKFKCPQCGQMIGFRRPGAAAAPPRPALVRPTVAGPVAAPRRAPPPTEVEEEDDDDEPEERYEAQPRAKKKKRREPPTNHATWLVPTLGGIAALVAVGLGIAFLPGLFGGKGTAAAALPRSAPLAMSVRPAALAASANPRIKALVAMAEAQNGGSKVTDIRTVLFAMSGPGDFVFAIDYHKRVRAPGKESKTVETHRGVQIYRRAGMFTCQPSSATELGGSTLPAVKQAIDRVLDGTGGLALPAGHDLVVAIDAAKLQSLTPGAAANPATKDMQSVLLTGDLAGDNVAVIGRATMTSAQAASDAAAKANAERGKGGAMMALLPPQVRAFAQMAVQAKVEAAGNDVVVTLNLSLDALMAAGT